MKGVSRSLRPIGPALPLAALLLAAAATLTGCAGVGDTVPSCTDPLRLAIVAQSVPTASYLPCLAGLPPGWTTAAFDATQDGTSFLLNSDRSPGRPVTVELTAACRTDGASLSPSRAPGVLSYTRLYSVTPRFAGRLFDVFPGGCVSYRFDFTEGLQVSLVEDVKQAVGLYPRPQLRVVLKEKLGVELSP